MVAVILIVLAIIALSGIVVVSQPDILNNITHTLGIGNPLDVTNPFTLNPETLPHQAKNSFKDFVGTVTDKINVPQNNQLNITQAQANDIKASSKTAIFSGLDFLGAVKHIAGDVLSILAPKLFGFQLPSFVIPSISLIVVILLASSIIKHAGKTFYIVLILGLLVVTGLAFTGVGK